MNINDSTRAKIEASVAQAPIRSEPAASSQTKPSGVTASKGSGETDLITTGNEAKTPGVAPTPAPQAPISTVASTGASLTDAHASMDAEKANLVAQLTRGGTLADAAKAAKRIAELHGKPRHADEVCAMADRLIENKDQREQVKLAASLVVLGEWKSPAKVMLGGRLSDEDKRAHIFPINARAAEVLRQIPGGEPLAQAVEGKTSQGVTPLLHATRDISAMDAPRKWRQDESHPDGRLSLQEIYTELLKNNERAGRDDQVTANLFARYQVLRSE